MKKKSGEKKTKIKKKRVAAERRLYKVDWVHSATKVVVATSIARAIKLAAAIEATEEDVKEDVCISVTLIGMPTVKRGVWEYQLDK